MHFTPNARHSVYYRPLSRKLRYSSFPGQNDIYFTYLILKNYLFLNVAVKYFMFMNVAARGYIHQSSKCSPKFFWLKIYEMNDTQSFNIIPHRVYHLWRQLCLRFSRFFKIGSYLHVNFTNTDLHHRNKYHTLIFFIDKWIMYTV